MLRPLTWRICRTLKREETSQAQLEGTDPERRCDPHQGQAVMQRQRLRRTYHEVSILHPFHTGGMQAHKHYILISEWLRHHIEPKLWANKQSVCIMLGLNDLEILASRLHFPHSYFPLFIFIFALANHQDPFQE